MRDLVKMSDIIRIYNNYDYDKAREEVMKLPSIDMVGELEKIKAEIREWYWQADKQKISKDPCVVDAMTDLFIRTVDNHIAELKSDNKHLKLANQEDLCKSCTNVSCEFQSGIKRSSCAFYMPPRLESDNCGNYIYQIKGN